MRNIIANCSSLVPTRRTKAEFTEWHLIESISQRYWFLCPTDTKELLYYENGVFRKGGEEVIERWLQKVYLRRGENPSTYKIKNVIEGIKRLVYVERRELDPDRYLCLKNVVIDLESLETKGHSPDFKLTRQLPIEYDPTAKCPRFERFLEEVLHEEDVPTVWKMIAYLFQPNNVYEKAFLLVGDGANGKSTLLNLLREMLGIENVASVSLYDLANNRFASGQLFNKFANLYPDLDERAVKYTGVLKAITSMDTFSFEQKHKPPITSIPRAKHIFACNRTPEVRDESHAFWRRWIIIEFPRSFTEKERDPHLLDKLKKEIPGVFNKALEWLAKLREEGGFKDDPNAFEKWTSRGDTVFRFVHECCNRSPDSWILKDDLYLAYVEFCIGRGEYVVTKTTFTQRLEKLGNIRAKQKKVGGRIRYIYDGICLAR